MAKINLIKNNFTSGELSPHIWMRTDLQQYRNGTKEMLNFLPIVEGGLKRRGGTAVTAVTEGAVRILPFIISHSVAYLLVFKALSIDVLDSNGTLIKSLVTPYTVQDIKEINYTQNRYQFFIAHSEHPLAWVRASEDLTNWAYDEFDFYVPPLEEVTTPTLPLKPNEKNAGKTVTLTASAYAVYDSTKRYQVGDICHHTISGTRYYFRAKKITQGNTPTLGQPSQGGTIPDEYWGTTSVTEAQAFTAADVNKFVFINEGIIRIDKYVSPSTVLGEILLKLNTDIEAIGNSWTLKQDIFEVNLGYPRAVTMYQQRLVIAGTKTYPNYVWLSRVGDVTNFLPTVADGDSFTVSASSDQLTNVLHLAQSRGICVMTGGSELVISSQNAMTPTNTSILEHTSFGSTENIKPLKVGSELIFVQRGAERVRTLLYDYSIDSLTSSELTVLASHIAKKNGGFKEMVYCAEPDSIIWFVLGNGKLASLTLNREQSVIAWSTHDIGGTVLSVTSLPSTTGSDRLYFLVNRNGTVQIEQMKEELLLDSVIKVNVQHNNPCIIEHTQIGVLGNDVAAYYKDGNSTYSLPILNRQGNTLTIDCDPSVHQVYIGRKFTSRVSLFAPELQGSPATSSPSIIKINHINLYLYESLNPTVNGEMVELKQFTDNIFVPPVPYTGSKRIEMNGWADFDNFKLIIEQSEPLPLHITAVVMEQNINDR
ncbi:phage-like protein [Acinetobacter baumannii]|nr:phage-like protein [Acinetobacter baumannii]